MRLVYSPRYEVDIGPHVFPTSKYRLVRDSLIGEDRVPEEWFVEPSPAPTEDLLLVHTQAYLDDLLGIRWTPRTMRSELPITGPIVQASVLAADGTARAVQMAIEGGRICVHVGGGFHHAFADHAEGFCYVNDIAVGIRVAQRGGKIRRALVVDCDLHQGNGTAHIFQHDDSVFTVSLHQENNYPVKQRSNIDVGLDDWTGDDEYLEALARVVPQAMQAGRPDLLVYVAGADAYEGDQLGALRLTMAGLAERDRYVIDQACGAGVPVAVVFAGGYARELADTVAIHRQTCRIAMAAAASS
jgi:acetoin utilization deacetylase AcuC-like enzyme